MGNEFIPVGALGDGFAPGADLLEPTAELVGTSFALDLDGPDLLRIGDGTASWGAHEDVPVRVTSIRPGIHLVDGLAAETSTTFVLDTEAGLVTIVEGRLPDERVRAESAHTRVRRGDEPTGVTARIAHGALDGSAAARHAPTDELVGLRNRYTYSPNEIYEHIYLNPQRFTWHCLRGVERGLADTDRCHHIAIRDGLVLFVWREKIVPTLGLLLIDLHAMRTDGKIFGNDGFGTSSVVNFPVGSRAEVLGRTTS